MKKNNNHITVIVTTYNHEKFISECLKSILYQKGISFKIIVADDFSTDNNTKIIKQFMQQDSRIILLETKQNLGLQQNLKRAIEQVDTKYYAICEGDDFWIDEYKLLKQYEYMEAHPECSMCYNSIIIYSEKNKNYFLNISADEDKDKITIEDITLKNPINNFSCCFYRKSIFDKFRQDLWAINFADWLFNIYYAQEGGNAGHLLQPMSVYRLHESSLFSNLPASQKYKMHIEHALCIDEFFNYEYTKTFKQLIERLNKCYKKAKHKEFKHKIKNLFRK